MARATITKTTPLGSYGAYSGVLAKLNQTAADVSNKNMFAVGGNDLVIAHNTGASPATVTFNSVADPQFGRTGDITAYSIPAGELAVFGPFKPAGWSNSGYINCEASAADVKFSVIAVP